MLGRATLSATLALGLLVGAWPSPLAAQDIAGEWLLSVDLSAGSGEAVFVFEVSGNEITGTYEGILGEEAVTGTIEGNEVQFGFESAQAGTVSFEGVVDGDTMEGECFYGALGAGSFTGSKVE